MEKFAIVADCTCDLSEELEARLGVDVLAGHVALPDRTEIPSPRKWERWTREEFYADLKKDPSAYTTSPPNVAEFEAALEKYAAEGTGVLAMTISSGISGTFSFLQQAKKNVLERHPEAEIECLDTLRFGPGFGLMVMHAAELRAEGKTLAEVAAYFAEKRNCYHQAGWLDDLSFVAKQGRISHPKAFFGQLAGVKPIGEFDYNGMTTVLGKAKGARQAYSVLLDYIEATIVEPEKQTVVIAQTNRPAAAEQYKKMIEERFHPREVVINDVFPACGINIGPGLMAAYYVGKPISSDLSEERAIIEKAIGQGDKQA